MKKKINVPLTVITIVIWSVIVYNFANVLLIKNDEENTDLIENNNLINERTKTEYKDFVFEHLELDPFSLLKKEKTIAVVEKPREIKPLQIITSIIQPSIQFDVNGVVINNENKNIILNDRTNNKIVFLREGEEYEGIKIQKVWKDSIQFIHPGSNKSIISRIN